MPTITSTELGAATRFIELAGSALNDIGAQTVLAYHRPTAGGGENGSGAFMQKTPVSSTSGPRFNASHNANVPRHTGGFDSTGVAGAPNRTGGNNTITYGSWQHSAMTWTGSLTATNVRFWGGIGVDITETSYLASSNGTVAVDSDAADPMYLMNRLGLDRAYVGDFAYIVIWPRVLSLAELIEAQNNGPFQIPGMLFLYANQQIYDPDGNGVTIASRSTYVAGAVPPNTALGNIIVDDNFERSSLNTPLSSISGLGDAAIISLRPSLQENETVSNETRWQTPAARITGVNGIRPTFRFTGYGSGVGGYWQFPWDAVHRPKFTYDFVSWTAIDTAVTVNANDITFRHSVAFTQDVVYIGTQFLWTNTQLAAWVTALAAANPTLVKHVASNISGFVSGTFAPQTNLVGRTSPSLNFHGFKIQDDTLQPASGGKRTMVLVNGVHAGEDNGDRAWMGAIEYLLTGGTEALNLRRHFVIYCYSQVNAPGRWLGGFRGGYVTDVDGKNDANRNFNDLATTLEIVTIPRAAMNLDTPAHWHVEIDFHTEWADDYALFVNGTLGPIFLTALNVRMSPAVVADHGASTAGSVTHYAGTVKTADVWATAEVAEAQTLRTLPQLVTWGENLVKTVSDLLDAGQIPAADGETTPVYSGDGWGRSDFHHKRMQDEADRLDRARARRDDEARKLRVDLRAVAKAIDKLPEAIQDSAPVVKAEAAAASFVRAPSHDTGLTPLIATMRAARVKMDPRKAKPDDRAAVRAAERAALEAEQRAQLLAEIDRQVAEIQASIAAQRAAEAAAERDDEEAMMAILRVVS